MLKFVTIVAWSRATGAIIPCIILYKDKRLKPDWIDNLSVASACEMTPNDIITAQTFVK